MSSVIQRLATGWQQVPLLMAWMGLAAVLSGLLAMAVGGAVSVGLVLTVWALTTLDRLQWAALDGSALRVRDLRSGFVFRDVRARSVSRVVYRRNWLPYSRIELRTDADGDVLVLHGPSPTLPSLRSTTLWMIVHGRRQTRIDPCLLDALAAMPEHVPASLPRDASHA